MPRFAGTLVLFFFVSCTTSVPEQVAKSDLSQTELADGFVSLFDGKTLDLWRGGSDCFSVENGILVCKKTPGEGKDRKLFTKKEYGDFAFRFEFKLTPNSNNGVAIRAPLEGDPAFAGMEIQIIDNSWAGLKPYQVHGSIYGVVPAKRGHLKPTGEWNSEEILCEGRHVKVTLNGAVIVDANLDEVQPIDGDPHPGLQRRKGHLGLLGHTSRVEFRNLRIKDLSVAGG